MVLIWSMFVFSVTKTIAPQGIERHTGCGATIVSNSSFISQLKEQSIKAN
jgi:hypothetical protein